MTDHMRNAPVATGGQVWTPSVEKSHRKRIDFYRVAMLTVVTIGIGCGIGMGFIFSGHDTYNNSVLVSIQQKCAQAVDDSGENIFDNGGGNIYTGLKIATVDGKQVVYESSIKDKTFILRNHDTGKQLCSVNLATSK